MNWVKEISCFSFFLGNFISLPGILPFTYTDNTVFIPQNQDLVTLCMCKDSKSQCRIRHTLILVLTKMNYSINV